MIHRTLLLAGVFAAFCFGNPETIVFTGTADGALAGKDFTNKKVTFTFLTDTAAIAPGTYCCYDNLTTPAGTQGSFVVEGVGSGTMTGTQGVFVNELEGQMGIWFYDYRDYFDILWPVGKYDLKTNYGPVTGTTFVFAGPMFTTAGDLYLRTMQGASATVTVSTTPAPKPVITSVTAAYGDSGSSISQNTWIAIKGTNLTSAQTQAIGVNWVGSQPYLGGYMEPKLNGVEVTVNGKPAVVSFYCSAAPSGSICKQDQINALVALDATTGPVKVVVTNGGVASDPFTVTMSTVSPALLRFQDDKNYVTATHANYSLIGPTTLYTGLSTPATVGETVVLWAVGFGLPSTTLVANADTQSGPLSTMPLCQINGASATVSYAGVVSPGLYQINLVVPNGATNGDNKISCTYNGATTQANNSITVSR
jgi:uncharacterized protein (TIGR03437 family)